MAAYARRIIDDELDDLQGQIAAIALEGPKAVGKTATAMERAATVYQVDNRATRALLEAGPSVWAGAPKPILFDEWQRWPSVWDEVRRAVDIDHAPDQFLLTGSALPPYTGENDPHSGAGRIVSIRMRPLSLAERAIEQPTVSLGSLLTGESPPVSGRTVLTAQNYTREIVSSGFPAIRTLTGRAQRAQLDAYLERVVNRDFRDAGHVIRRPARLRRWLAAYAAATSTITSQEKIREAAVSGEGKIASEDADQPFSRKATHAYREVLERLWLLEPLEGWTPSWNHLKRVAQAPRHHLADPALAARLLGATEDTLLNGTPSLILDVMTRPRDGTLLGQLFESLVTQSVRVYAQRHEARVRHFRTWDGRQEIDLIVERADSRVVAIEVKLSASAEKGDMKHLLWLKEQMGTDLLDMVLVNTGPHAYRHPNGVAVVPAALLGA
ncbi:MAG: ATP-binding protein [Phycisphaerae bacterium]|nr:ATP-binding protein [Gemmatimonadaceae bacterium]